MKRDVPAALALDADAMPLRSQAAAWAAAAAQGQPLEVLAHDVIGPAWQSVLDAPAETRRRGAVQWLHGVLALGRWVLPLLHDSAVPPLAARLLALEPHPPHRLRLHLELWLPMDARLTAAAAWSRGITQVLDATRVPHRIEHHLWPDVAQREPAPSRALWCWGCLSMLPASDFGGAP